MFKAYAFQVHFEGSNEEDRGVTIGAIAKTQEEAWTSIVSRYRRDIQNLFSYSSVTVMPLRQARIVKHGKEDGFFVRKVFKGLSAVGAGYLFYIKDDDGTVFAQRCKAVKDDKRIQCLIYRNDHDVEFAGK